MSLIKTFKLRNKMEIDMFVNDELLLTLTRPVYRDTSNTDDIIYFDLPNGKAELYVNPDKPNSLIYYTSSGDNQMALFLNDREIDDFLLLSYESDTDSDYDTDYDTESDSTPKQKQFSDKSYEESENSYDSIDNENEEKNIQDKDIEEKDIQDKDIEEKNIQDKDIEEKDIEENEDNEIEYQYMKVRVLERSVHPIDNNYFIYQICVNKATGPVICVSDKFYKISSYVNIDYYKKNILIKGVLSSGRIYPHKLGFINWVKNWFGF